MSGGPISPTTIFPVTANRITFGVHVGAGANSKNDEGLQFEASLGADATWDLRFPMPPDLPSGTCKLRYQLIANLGSLVAKINVAWASVANGEVPSSATMNDEGTTSTTFALADAYHEVKVTLDADTPVKAETIVMQIKGITSGWTANQIVTLLRPEIIFE